LELDSCSYGLLHLRVPKLQAIVQLTCSCECALLADSTGSLLLLAIPAPPVENDWNLSHQLDSDSLDGAHPTCRARLSHRLLDHYFSRSSFRLLLCHPTSYPIWCCRSVCSSHKQLNAWSWTVRSDNKRDPHDFLGLNKEPRFRGAVVLLRECLVFVYLHISVFHLRAQLSKRRVQQQDTIMDLCRPEMAGHQVCLQS